MFYDMNYEKYHTISASVRSKTCSSFDFAIGVKCPSVLLLSYLSSVIATLMLIDAPSIIVSIVSKLYSF